MEITGVGLSATFSTLFGTHLAAVAAVCDQADAYRAPRWGLRTLAWPLTVLSPRVGFCHGRDGGGHGGGGLGDGLKTEKQSLESVPEQSGLRNLW